MRNTLTLKDGDTIKKNNSVDLKTEVKALFGFFKKHALEHNC